MDTNLYEKNEKKMQTDVSLQNTLHNKNHNLEVSNCHYIINDELTYIQAREKVSEIILIV